MEMTSRMIRVAYRMWAPVYDRLFSALFQSARERGIHLLSLQPGERVLLVGVGTGPDLPLLPTGVVAVGIDASPAMLARAYAKAQASSASVSLIEADAQLLTVPTATFDAAVLNLILSVVPNGRACLDASLQAMQSGGRAVILDKFAPTDRPLTLARRSLNRLTSALGTDITRRFEDLAAGLPCEITHREPVMFNGAYQLIMIRKTE